MKISLNAVPKPQHERRTPKRVDIGKFSPLTTKHIFERDNHSCVRCGTSHDLESVPHHIIYKSAMGLGEKSNGCTICRTCHREAHSLRKVRQWFEQYRLTVLIPFYEMREAE
jgi:5-methylcytosine-specific restriction endonuclease McrA